MRRTTLSLAQWVQLTDAQRTFLFDARAKTRSAPLYWHHHKVYHTASHLEARHLVTIDRKNASAWSTMDGMLLVQEAIRRGYQRKAKPHHLYWGSSKYPISDQ